MVFNFNRHKCLAIGEMGPEYNVSFFKTMATRTTVKKTYSCDCDVYCHSRRKQVSRSTYQRHAPYRLNPGQLSIHSMTSGRRQGVLDHVSSGCENEVQAQEVRTEGLDSQVSMGKWHKQ